MNAVPPAQWHFVAGSAQGAPGSAQGHRVEVIQELLTGLLHLQGRSRHEAWVETHVFSHRLFESSVKAAHRLVGLGAVEAWRSLWPGTVSGRCEGGASML